MDESGDTGASTDAADGEYSSSHRHEASALLLPASLKEAVDLFIHTYTAVRGILTTPTLDKYLEITIISLCG